MQKNHGTPENIHGDWDHSTHENGTTQVRDCTQEKVVESELKCSVNSENSTAERYHNRNKRCGNVLSNRHNM